MTIEIIPTLYDRILILPQRTVRIVVITPESSGGSEPITRIGITVLNKDIWIIFIRIIHRTHPGLRKQLSLHGEGIHNDFGTYIIFLFHNYLLLRN